MKLKFRCHPEHEAQLPKPVPAKAALPDWLRQMPTEAYSEAAGISVRTLKHCLPFIDAMSHGVLMPLTCDLTISGGQLSWSSALPVIESGASGRSPIGVHVPEQATGAPFADQSQFIVKFMNYWAIEAPPGWSVLFCHPLNRLDLPFRTVTGLVDCDAFALGLVHFPALWVEPDFDGVLPAGTPVAQCFPVPRESLEIEVAVLTAEELSAQDDLRLRLAREKGVYRKTIRH